MKDKDSYLIIYYADTKKPLTFHERLDLHDAAVVVSATPREVLLRSGGRLVVVTKAGLPNTPEVPPRKP